jgi:LysR family transcriptional regulator for bpeEF and oprC
MDFIDKLRVFTAVADHQSFARASEALAMYRPRVTNAVTELEKEVGARLLHRTTRKTTLTREGTAFYDQARATLTAVGDARGFFDGGNAIPKGRVRADMSNSIARSTIIPRLHEFQAAYPEVDVVLGVSDQQVDLIAEGVDCVLRLGQLGNTSMVSRILSKVPRMVCASPAYLARHGTPRTVEELKTHKAVTYFYGRDQRVRDWQYFVEGEAVALRLPAAVQVNDHEGYVSCALHGLGVAQLQEIGIREQLQAGTLVQILDTVDWGTMPLTLMYPARAHVPLQVRVFMDWTVSLFESAPAARPARGGAAPRG